MGNYHGVDAQDLFSSPAPYTRAAVRDDDALLTATAAPTSAAVVAKTGTPGVTIAYNGAEDTAVRTNGNRPMPRTLMVTTGVNAGTWKVGAGNKWTATGTYNGAVQTEDFVLVTVNGGDVLIGTKPFDDPDGSVIWNIPGQNNAGATFKLGCDRIVAPNNGVFRGVKGLADGTIVVLGPDDLFDVLNVKAGIPESVFAKAICAADLGSGTTTVGVCAYI